MKKIFLTFFIFSIINTCFGQNEYQAQLYSLTDRLNAFEKKHLLRKVVDRDFLPDKLDLIKDLHRLGEEAATAGIENTLEAELGILINSSTEAACNRLNFLEYYLTYKRDLYKLNYDRSKTIFLSLFLKVKSLEK